MHLVRPWLYHWWSRVSETSPRLWFCTGSRATLTVKQESCDPMCDKSGECTNKTSIAEYHFFPNHSFSLSLWRAHVKQNRQPFPAYFSPTFGLSPVAGMVAVSPKSHVTVSGTAWHNLRHSCIPFQCLVLVTGHILNHAFICTCG